MKVFEDMKKRVQATASARSSAAHAQNDGDLSVVDPEEADDFGDELAPEPKGTPCHIGKARSLDYEKKASVASRNAAWSKKRESDKMDASPFVLGARLYSVTLGRRSDRS